LTINAIALDPLTEELVDPFGGRQDLQKGIIKAVGNPEDRFREDGLRIMRAARFAARFGYKVDPDTLLGMRRSMETLRKVSKERINDELCKLLMAKHPNAGLDIMIKTGMYFVFSNVLESTHLERPIPNELSLEFRIALLYYVKYGDFKRNIALIEQELIDLKFSNNNMKKIIFLLRACDLYDNRGRYNYDFSDAHIVLSSMFANYQEDYYSMYFEFIKLYKALFGYYSVELIESPYPVHARRDLQIDGNDLMALGIPPGPQIKKLLDECYQHVLFHHMDNKKAVLIELIKSKPL
jgi:tRNA nucleotidyltransferase (CCA-adding enzyme)